MSSRVWRKVAKWLLLLPVGAASFIAAFAVSEWSMVVGYDWVRWADASGRGLQTSALISLQGVIDFVLICLVLVVPVALTVAFALDSRLKTALQWGISVALLLTGWYVWVSRPDGSSIAPHIVVILAGLILLSVVVVFFLRIRRPTIHAIANLLVFGLFLVPSLISLAMAPKGLPESKRLWSVELQKGTWEAMNTGSEYGATRHLVVAGDRIVALYDAGSAPYVDKQPMSNYKLVSLDLKTGTALNEQTFVGRWGAMPYLYANQDGKVILAKSSLTQLNPDLSNTRLRLEITHGQIGQISPDGSTMAWDNLQETIFIDASSLVPTGLRLRNFGLGTVNRNAIVTSSLGRATDYPKDSEFLTLIDQNGIHLIFHGDCGWWPHFLRNDRIFISGCGKVRILDLSGKILHETKVEGNATFAGVSRNGQRFAVVSSDGRGDPSRLIFEHFTILDTETGQPIGMIRMRHLPERQSWSAFSPNGKLFVVGGPAELSLYQLP